ncbi:MAG: UrcA family protein [Rhizorhabdus sp.]|nr:UrcA family protein [Rhizorhabdus sp.]
MVRSSLFTAAVLAASALSAPLFAQELPRAEIRYNDLALKTPQGAEQLKARVQRAARSVCGLNGAIDLRGRMEGLKCAETAAARAMPQVELAIANAQRDQLADNGRLSVAAH